VRRLSECFGDYIAVILHRQKDRRIFTCNNLITTSNYFVVLAEDKTGWWKGQIGERIGFFPISSCKYEEKTDKETKEAVRSKFSTKRWPTLRGVVRLILASL
jgi:hypothetical protein